MERWLKAHPLVQAYMAMQRSDEPVIVDDIGADFDFDGAPETAPESPKDLPENVAEEFASPLFPLLVLSLIVGTAALTTLI